MAVGKIEPFNVNSDNWTLYVERLEQYFIINDVKLSNKVPMLITLMGAQTYELLVNLCSPKKPAALSFKEITDILGNYLQPSRSVLAERYKFRQRVQKSTESVADYVTELKKLARTCSFETTLDENLRDQLACGLHSETIRQRLFAEDNVDFHKAFKLAQALESAVKDAAAVTEKIPSAICQNMASERRGGGSYEQASTAAKVWEAGSRWERDGQGTRSSGGAGAGAGRPRGRGGRRLTGTGTAAAKRAPIICQVCGGQHGSVDCKFKNYVCRVCNREGHLKKVCPKLKHNKFTTNNYVEVDDRNSEVDSDEVIKPCYNLSYLNLQYDPYIMLLEINNKKLPMEIDTGSTISCISSECYNNMFKECPLWKSNVVLRYYTGESVQVLGKIRPKIVYNGIKRELDLYILQNARTSLIGREWLHELRISLPKVVYNINSDIGFNMNEFSSRFCEVFAEGLGRFTGEPVQLRLRDDARPVFMRARPLAYAMREPVERALDQMVSDGIIVPVASSEWATPIVPVVKPDGSIRICGDFKLTLNKYLEIDRYPVPRIEDLLVKLNGGDKFSKIDLSQAYAQFPLDDTKKCTTINTHKGLFQYNRLIYGLASSPGIFQRKLEQMFADLPTVGVYLDDVIITAQNDNEHMQILHEVFGRLQKYGLKIKKEKCCFFANSVTYLGYVISKNGIETSPNKVEAIKNIPPPNNITELRSFIGMIMYYAKFIKNISTILAPLYELLKKNKKYVWSSDCMKAFLEVKSLLGSARVLAHYSAELPLVLTTDASSTGVGAVISHIMPTGEERPIAFASRVLNTAEKGYSQIEKEALAIIYGVKKYHQYLYGRKFLLKTDHKPLVAIFGNKYGIPTMAASRLQRWAVIMSGYIYDIEYVSSEKNGADALSRLPCDIATKQKAEITYLNFVQDFRPVQGVDIKKGTEKDEVLCKVIMYISSGWPSNCNDDRLKPYYIRRNELYVEGGCVMWGYRIVVPEKLQDKILKELHVGHMGIVKMKGIARSYVWWPGIDAAVERVCRECVPCAAEACAPPRAPPQAWPFHHEPWSRLHLDFLGPLDGETFLVLVDASTKWIEAFRMTRTTSTAVIKVLRETFARFGLPKEVVSDNATQFSSQELAEFFQANGIKQTFSPTYHPSSNGAAENAVKLIKKAIKKGKREKLDIDVVLQAYLMAYRNTEHSTTGSSPASLLQKRSLRSRLDLLRNARTVENKVYDAQSRQLSSAGGRYRKVAVGEEVWAREHANPDRWTKGRIKEEIGSRNYVVEKENGTLVKKHIDQLKSTGNRSRLVWPDLNFDQGGSSNVSSRGSCISQCPVSGAEEGEGRVPSASAVVSGATNDAHSSGSIPERHRSVVTRSGRTVKPTRRYIEEID